MDIIAIFLDEISKVSAYYSESAPLPENKMYYGGGTPGKEIPKPVPTRAPMDPKSLLRKRSNFSKMLRG